MIEDYLQWIEAEIKKLTFGDHPRSLYEPLRYVMGLGGKRIRPLLTLLSYSLFKSDVRGIVPMAVAVEVFHNFTLLHDDIMDEAPLRRGKATVHKKWNVSTAILSGDVMQIKVYEMLGGVPDSKLKEVILAFNQCATEVCEGQQFDMEFEKKTKVSEAEYIEMIRLKTAILLGFSLQLGAIMADAPREDQLALREFGINLGISFQLRDDVLDVYADKKKFGKQVGGDIIANKKTYLLVKAMQVARGKDKVELDRWLRKKTFDRSKKVKAITTLYNSLMIPLMAEVQVKHYFDRAFDSLQKVTSGQKAELMKLAERLLQRDM